MSHLNRKLPYQLDELEPFLSKESLQTHFIFHHQYHLDVLNKLIQGTRFSSMNLVDIVHQSEGDIFFNASEVWNHQFFWQCLSPISDKSTSRQPSEVLLIAIENDFNSFSEFRKKFEQKAIHNNGAGWTWLVQSSNGKLGIVNTDNAVSPILDINSLPILAIDVWEHAYYLDYLNNKKQYLNNFWRLVNWSFVSQLFLSNVGSQTAKEKLTALINR